ncbi:hypothetical protein MKW94_000287 [Papaver nudicaule]|uniref:Cupin type-1 domain-containing protein n=1 Tax=Papaver nudicaule TaxID=74823 RepID=A0AA42AZS3_PAPNU|nr:hypothetical protein [Papaver nudicaule]
MKFSSLVCLGFCFVFVLNGCLAQIEQQGGGWQTQQQQQQPRHYQGQSECRIENLNAQEPNRRVESEAGVTEFWDQNNEQFECAGVAATRYIIQPRGLLLPSFANAPRLAYIVQGRGLTGALIPGCPETFQSIRQSQQFRGESQQQSSRDQHQKIRSIRQGDVLALPAGVSHWCYNEGETPLVAIVVHDTSSSANQLDRNLRRFQLAGSQQTQTSSYQQRQQQQREQTRGQQDIPENNIFSGFNVETLAEAFGVSTETARKLQGQNDQRGNIVFVEGGLQVIKPRQGEEEEKQEQRYRTTANGLFYTLKCGGKSCYQTGSIKTHVDQYMYFGYSSISYGEYALGLPEHSAPIYFYREGRMIIRPLFPYTR